MNSRAIIHCTLERIVFETRRVAQEFAADFMVASPDHLASPTRFRSPCQMEREVLWEIINITDR
jgi:hypothetical protein